MGFLDKLKSRLGSSSSRSRDETSTHLVTARNNLKLAFDYIGNFFDDTKNFEPAIRHRELYFSEVLGKLKLMRGGIKSGISFLDEKLRNEINTQNSIRSIPQLKQIVEEWIKSLNSNDEKVYDIIKILEIEMWSEEKAKRGFPVPKNKEMVYSYLTKSLEHLREARTNLDNSMAFAAAPEVS